MPPMGKLPGLCPAMYFCSPSFPSIIRQYLQPPSNLPSPSCPDRTHRAPNPGRPARTPREEEAQGGRHTERKTHRKGLSHTPCAAGICNLLSDSPKGLLCRNKNVSDNVTALIAAACLSTNCMVEVAPTSSMLLLAEERAVPGSRRPYMRLFVRRKSDQQRLWRSGFCEHAGFSCTWPASAPADTGVTSGFHAVSGEVYAQSDSCSSCR